MVEGVLEQGRFRVVYLALRRAKQTHPMCHSPSNRKSHASLPVFYEQQPLASCLDS